MKLFTFKNAPSFGQIRIFGLAIMWLFSIANSQKAYSAETSTNWNWVNLTLSVVKTNLAIGEPISASMIVSNCADTDHVFYGNAGDPCVCGPGQISVVEVSSGKTIPCNLSTLQRGGMQNNFFTTIQGHAFKAFDLDLIAGHNITNAGVYQVQGMGWFPIVEPPTNNQFAAVTTPPVIILLSPKMQQPPPNK